MQNPIIYKYVLNEIDVQGIYLPRECQLLDIQVQNGQIVYWVLLNSYAAMSEFIELEVIGTGNYISDQYNRQHLKTIQMPSGLVWHIFKRIGRI